VQQPFLSFFVTRSPRFGSATLWACRCRAAAAAGPAAILLPLLCRNLFSLSMLSIKQARRRKATALTKFMYTVLCTIIRKI
jgi:hypothetical protein